MMKSIKIFLAVAMIGAFSAPLTEMSAQTRKTTTKKTTATTRKPAAKTTAKATAAAAKKVDINGYYYEGALKMDGAADLFSTIDFVDNEANVDFAGALSLTVNYTATESAGKMSIKLSSDNVKSTLTSNDKGESLNGSLTLGPNTAKAWYLKVKKNHTTPTIDAAQLEEIIGNPDGYTAFVIGEQVGQKVCFMADAEFVAGTKNYTVTFDTPTLQKVFGKLAGSYSVEDNKLIMTDQDGSSIKGDIYDDATYLSLPMGSGQGFKFTLIFVR